MKPGNFKLERYFARHEFEAPYLLSSSDCETLRINELLSFEEGSEQRFLNLQLGYTESQGSPGLRNAISGLYTGIQSENVLVFSGAEEGIFTFMNTILEPGDHVIVQFPAYQSLYEVAKSIGCEVTRWIMNNEKNWDLDLDQLTSYISPRTKAIIINFPHNPTGGMVNERMFAEIINIARTSDLYLFSDEVYRFLEFEGKTLPAACDLYGKAVSLGVMSKAFGLAGLRIGWIATRDNILDEMASYKDYTTICNSAPSEYLAEIALHSKKKILDRNLRIIISNLKVLDDFFSENRDFIEWNRPKAGSVAFPRLKQGLSSSTFSRDVLVDKGVLLLLGNLFDYGDSHFRIGYGRKNMPEALMRLDDFLSAYNV